MTRRWMLVGLMGLGPLLAEAHWQDNASLSPSEPTSARAQAIPQEGSSPSAVQPPERVAQELTVAPGDTLNALLQQLGADSDTRTQASKSLAERFDPRRLRPGDRLTFTSLTTGQPVSVTIERDSGIQYVVTLGERPSTRIVPPRLDTLTLGREVDVETSLYAALAAEGIPTRFAVDLEVLLGGLMDTARDISGAERLQLLWEEDRREDGTRVGPPRLTYMGLADQSARLEMVWPADQRATVMLYKDGSLVETKRFPVVGARLTSAFGNRRHPVYGGVRRHDGVDLAAPRGTPVMATAPGRVSFIGRRGGYGRVVEVEHEMGTLSRYTHLSRFASGLSVGDVINAGDTLGEVGASGLTTGPNLHYEVRVGDRPVDPLEEGQRIILGESPAPQDYRSVLFEARGRLQKAIGTSGLVALDNR
ncbi:MULTISPECIES: M23 family metallopeptidase [Halomonadaceae]|jgi:murein DD-endopeptidase MepM/ murein hydrolase activator NlpD|nr:MULTISPECIES: M23 family metallopeptidase [Halomonas]SEG14133.1 Peptidase family M23 [Halomonas desiderata]SEG33691.1 Peptidase family M23 [Halomonas desiderata]SEG44342.1 Peptidase family M23 [Halomonas desiderata]